MAELRHRTAGGDIAAEKAERAAETTSTAESSDHVSI
jgi:hypothetical protein